MASTRSLLRIFAVPLMPIDVATVLSSSSFIADRPDTGRVVVSDTKDPSPSFAAPGDSTGPDWGQGFWPIEIHVGAQRPETVASVWGWCTSLRVRGSCAPSL